MIAGHRNRSRRKSLQVLRAAGLTTSGLVLAVPAVGQSVASRAASEAVSATAVVGPRPDSVTEWHVVAEPLSTLRRIGPGDAPRLRWVKAGLLRDDGGVVVAEGGTGSVVFYAPDGALSHTLSPGPGGKTPSRSIMGLYGRADSVYAVHADDGYVVT